jgi:surfactin synthase thioesterase subunit
MKHGQWLEKVIGERGKPWGGASTAIVAALGVRLIHQALLISDLDSPLKEDLSKCFQLCDADEKLFESVLHKEDIPINEVTIKLYMLMEKVINKSELFRPFVKPHIRSDFELGKMYCQSAAQGCVVIVAANKYEGLNDEDAKTWAHKLSGIEKGLT